MKNAGERHLLTFSKPKSPIAEAYRTLRTNIHFAGLDSPYRTILVTSPGPEEGKSTALANLGAAIAQAGKKVLIIDCDLRKPVQHEFFELPNQKGLTNVLVEQLQAEDAVQATKVDNLAVLTSGPIPPNPSELLGSSRMEHLVDYLAGKFETILLDSPPAATVTDAAVLSAQADGVILVLRAGKAKIEMAKQAKEQIEKANGKIIGAVLYGVNYSGEDYHYYYYYGEKKGRRLNG